MKSQTLKVISFAELVIGIIGSIAAGAIFKTVDTESVLISEVEREIASFNYVLALSIAVSVIILFIILYALYSILNNVETIRATVSDEKTTELAEEIIENKDTRPEVVAVESWGKPSEMSQEVYEAVLSLLDDMDEYTANNMSTELFKECVNKAYKVVKGQCNSNSSAVDNYFKVELQKIISAQCIAVEEVEVHKEKFLKKLNFEK